MTVSIHPFPARMAPELALKSLEQLHGGVVLDPMSGSGTVARVAKERNLTALGFDLDPLAVLISKVATTRVRDSLIESSVDVLFKSIRGLDSTEITLDWIDSDDETSKFVDYWFGEPQQKLLRIISYILSRSDEYDINQDIADIFRIALSRIIITKKQAASLAQDTSHSRPHRVTLESDYDVLAGFEKSLRAVRKRLALIPEQGKVYIRRGDARSLTVVDDNTVDAVLTSPPYLNAIDYMRGHRMSLVWLGYSFRDLTKTRSNSIGSERKPDIPFHGVDLTIMKAAMGDLAPLSRRHHSMIERYVIDMHKMMAEVSRVLKPNCKATFVMGDSCLKGVYVRNSEALAIAGQLVGLGVAGKHERDLPMSSRYLPTPDSGALSKRMRKEVILTFTKPGSS